MRNARFTALLIGAGISVLTALLMLLTEPQMAIAWDEGYVLGREEGLRDWFHGLRDPQRFAAEWRPRPRDDELVQRPPRTPPPRPEQLDSRGKLLFDSDVLAWFWPFAREEPHGHPPFFALFGLLGDLLAPSWQELPRARLAPILLFSLTAGAVFSWAARRWGYWPAALAAGSWVLQPNLFGHGHYAAYDALLACFWVLSIILFTSAVEALPGREGGRIRWLATVALGVILGCAAATKLTGWFLPLPFLAWVVLYRSRQGFLTLVSSVAIAMVVLFILMPPWWGEPVVGLFRFLDSNLNRAKSIRINIQFLGTIYVTPKESLPWYNTLVWTVVVTPVGFLLLAVVGLFTAIRHWRTESIGVLLAGHWAFLMILRALPHVPGHDGVRLFLPAFGVLALLGGLGARRLAREVEPLGESGDHGRTARGRGQYRRDDAGAAVILQPVSGRASRRDQAGHGAHILLGWTEPEARRWLADNTAAGQTIEFREFPLSWLYLRRTGELPRRLAQVDPGVPQWVVLQNRPGAVLGC